MIIEMALALLHLQQVEKAAVSPVSPAVVVGVEDVDAVLTAFAAKSKARQKRILQAVRDAVGNIDEPFAKAITEYAERGAKMGAGRRVAIAKKINRPTGDVDWWENLDFPVPDEYRFGLRGVTPVNSAGKPEEWKIELRAMLLGYPPGTHFALAAILQELDTGSGVENFAMFLEAWRNGDESFYQALDRTAGTEGSIFFYDAMIGDFIKKFVPKNHPGYKRVTESLDTAHDALHASFLAYRQYRAFREAVALSLLLPPDSELPRRLSRYDAGGAGGYSTRSQIEILLRLYGQDPAKVVRMICESASPPPVPLWSRKYDPFTSFHGAFQKLIPEMLEIENSTNLLLSTQAELRKHVAGRISNTAFLALEGQGITAPNR